MSIQYILIYIYIYILADSLETPQEFSFEIQHLSHFINYKERICYLLIDDIM